MSGISECKIRETLKLIYDSYSEVDDFIFTTYNFDPDFFEEHIVTYLMGNEGKIKTVGLLNEANDWINNNHVSIYYDRGALIAGSSPLTMNTYPQMINNGVFHPKIIVIFGTNRDSNQKKAHLIVSSCNLTVSGYGHNREAFAAIGIQSHEVARRLLKFIEELEKHSDADHSELKRYLRKDYPTNNNIEFFWNYGGLARSERNLVDRLKELPNGDTYIISPYYDETGICNLMEEVSTSENRTIIPAKDRDFYNISDSERDAIRSNGINLSELVSEGNVPRFAHAKILIKGRYVVVGSYNFTSQALKGINAEAALIFKQKSVTVPDLIPVVDSRFPAADDLSENRDEATVNESCYIIVIVDWSEGKIYIKSQHLDANSEYILKIPFSVFEAIIKKEETEIKISEELEQVLITHKHFVVYKNGLKVFTGLIQEKNWQEARPEIGCSSLEEAIAGWYVFLPGERRLTEEYSDLTPLPTADDENGEIRVTVKQDSEDLFDNYYLVAQSFENLISEIEKQKEYLYADAPTVNKGVRYREWERKRNNATKQLYGAFKTNPQSMVKILGFLQKKLDDETAINKDFVYLWLVALYLRRAYTVLPKNLEAISLYSHERRAFSSSVRKIIEKCEKELEVNSARQEYIEWVKKELFIKRK